MGRSQVLYNRTKGRYKTRGGGGSRGGRGRGGIESSGQGRGARHGKSKIDTYKGNQNDGIDDYSIYSSQGDSGANDEKVPLDESIVLLADGSLSGHRNYYYYDGSQKQNEGEETTSFNILEAGGSINVPSMASSFETLSISKRLQIPDHIVSLAFRSEINLQNDDEEKKAPVETVIRDSKPVRTEDDDMSYMSYTIAGTRNRAAIRSDGQVEVRPSLNQSTTEKRNEYNPADKSILRTTQPVASKTDRLANMYSNLQSTNSALSKNSQKQPKHLIMQVISKDDPVEDRYFVLEAATSATSSCYEEVPRHEETHAIDDWLDQTISEATSTQNIPKAGAIGNSATQEEGRTFVKKPKVPIRSYGSSRSVIERKGDDNSATSSSPFLRHRNRKERLKQEQQRKSEADRATSITSVSTDDDDGEEDMFHTSDGNFVDSGVQLYEDSESDTGYRGSSNAKARTSANKKNAMINYVVHTTHVRTAPSAATNHDDEGENLDDWLDSVIE